MSEILIGTSGFSYDDWKGDFYPPSTTSKDYLEYYSRHFNVIELNFTYYRIPDERHSREMIERSDGKLEFVVKAFRQMTHEISEDSITKILPLFIKGISPFVEAGRLGPSFCNFHKAFTMCLRTGSISNP